MTNPRPMQAREQNLIDLYSHCQLGMTPKNFYAKWDVNHEAIARICDRSLSDSPALVFQGTQLPQSHAQRFTPSCPDGLPARTL